MIVTMRILILWFSLVWIAGAGNAQAQWIPQPDVQGLPLQETKDGGSGRVLAGKAEVVVGDVRRIDMEKKMAWSVDFGESVHQEDVIFLGPSGSCRILLQNGIVINLGGGTLAQLVSTEDYPTLLLWEGSVLLQAMPSIGIGKQPLIHLRTHNGVATLRAGSMAVVVAPSHEKTEVVVFHNRATWDDGDGTAKVILAGRSLTKGKGGSVLGPVDPERGKELRRKVNPELAVILEGMDALEKNKDTDRARTLFSHAQHVYPYNSEAAYFLGLMLLEAKELPSAVDQWERYESIDPVGAGKRGVTKQLTAMKMDQSSLEVKSALANERAISDQPPEPNSIAVTPFVNGGGEEYNVLGKGLAAMIIADLANVPKIKVLERAKIQMLLEEIKLSESGLVDGKARVRSGRLLKAEKVVVGDFRVE